MGSHPDAKDKPQNRSCQQEQGGAEGGLHMQQSQEAPGQPGISYWHRHLAVGAEQLCAEAPAAEKASSQSMHQATSIKPHDRTGS